MLLAVYSERTNEFLIGFDWGPVTDKFFFAQARKKEFVRATPIFYIKNERVLAIFIKATAPATSSFAFIKNKVRTRSFLIYKNNRVSLRNLFFRAQHEKKFLSDRPRATQSKIRSFFH